MSNAAMLRALKALDVEAKVSVLVGGAWLDGVVESIGEEVLLLSIPGHLVSIDMKAVSAIKEKYPA